MDIIIIPALYYTKIIQTFIVQDTEIKVLGNSHSNYKHLRVASVQ
jgi:hypothetical protein